MSKPTPGQPVLTSTLQEIEIAFQKLKFKLDISISPRLKLRAMADFCILLADGSRWEVSQSYFHELIPYFTELIRRETLLYQPFGHLNALYKTLTHIQNSDQYKTDRPRFNKTLKVLTSQTAGLAFYLGEWSQGLSVLLGHDWAEPEKFHSISSLDELLTVANSIQIPSDSIAIIESINDNWKQKSKGYSHDEVWIPLVEKWEGSSGTSMLVGTLYPLHLELEERNHVRTKDLIFFNNHQIALDDLFYYQAQDALQAARAQHKLLRRANTKRYTVVFGFPLTDYSYSGSSFGFGMSLLSLCALENENNLRYQHAISRGVAFTGGVAIQGELRPVNSDSLKEKISAAFFSPIESFFLPSDNLEFGQAILADLQQLHPHKKFDIIGEQSINSSLQWGDLVEETTMPFIIWI